MNGAGVASHGSELMLLAVLLFLLWCIDFFKNRWARDASHNPSRHLPYIWLKFVHAGLLANFLKASMTMRSEVWVGTASLRRKNPGCRRKENILVVGEMYWVREGWSWTSVAWC